MRITYRTPDGIQVPMLPKHIPYSSSVCEYKTVKLTDPSGDVVELGILRSRTEARNFMLSLLSASGLPYLTSRYYYPDMRSPYIEDMVDLARSDWTWLDSGFDESLYVIASDKFIDFEPAGYQEALTLLDTHDIQVVCYGNANEYVVFRCFIYWEPDSDDDVEIGMWRIDMTPPNDYNEHRWVSINNTEIAIPPWASSMSDVWA